MLHHSTAVQSIHLFIFLAPVWVHDDRVGELLLLLLLLLLGWLWLWLLGLATARWLPFQMKSAILTLRRTALL